MEESGKEWRAGTNKEWIRKYSKAVLRRAIGPNWVDGYIGSVEVNFRAR